MMAKKKNMSSDTAGQTTSGSIHVGTVGHEQLDNVNRTRIELLDPNGKVSGEIVISTVSEVNIGEMVENLVRMGLKKPIEWI